MCYYERTDRYDELMGQHSRIPPCCREWFRAVWVPFLWEKGGFAFVQYRGADVARYVRCPGCRQCNALNTLRICRRDCLGEMCSEVIASRSLAVGE